MANEVKNIIQELVQNANESEISVEFVEEHFPEFDRVDIVAALRQMEGDGLGVLAVGRRGKKTRFIKGGERIIGDLNVDKFNMLQGFVASMQDNEELVLDKEDKETVLTVNGAELYRDKNRTWIIDYLRILEQTGWGMFLIGRRSGKSRFIKGATRKDNKMKCFFPAKKLEGFVINKEEIDKMTSGYADIKEVSIFDDKPIASPPKKPASSLQKGCKFNFVNNVVFKMMPEDNQGFDTVEEVMKAANLDCDVEYVKDQLSKFGFFSIVDIAK